MEKQSTQTGAKGFSEDAVRTLRSMRLWQQKDDAKVEEVEAALKDGSLHVFDTSTFTVNGSSLEDLIAEGGDYANMLITFQTVIIMNLNWHLHHPLILSLMASHLRQTNF